MAPIVKDWRVVFMQAHERLFDLMPNEPEQENDAFKFVRIKQKFGVLRVDRDGEISNDTRTKILKAIDLAGPLGLHLRNLRSRRSPLQQSRLAGDGLRRARGRRSRTCTAALGEYPQTPPGRRQAGHVLRALRPGGRHL
jgi:hypothetical protein